LIYLVPESLIRFEPPAGYYFNTKKKNTLTAIPASGIIPAGGITYIWAEVVSVTGDGTAVAPQGAIVLNRVIPSTATVSQIIPKLSTSINTTLITTMIDLVFANKPFGLRYDIVLQSWQIIFESNLNLFLQIILAFAF
jgi:hypothetical protein